MKQVNEDKYNKGNAGGQRIMTQVLGNWRRAQERKDERERTKHPKKLIDQRHCSLM